MASLSTFDAFKHLYNAGGYHELSDADLKGLQAVLTDMMHDIDDVCKRRSVAYVLLAGSCLGAVRHKGFIPWDDDLDIGMTHADFDEFRSVFDEELGEKYILQTPTETKDYGLTFARVRRRGTTLKCRDDLRASGECGVYIDLFIWESVPDNKILRALHGLGSFAIGFGYSCRRFAWFGELYQSMVEGNESLARVFKLKNSIGQALSFASLDAWTRAWYRWNSLVKSQKTKYVCLPSGRRKYFGEMFERSMLYPPVEAEFGDYSFSIPRDPDGYLRLMYGDDYMTPPPVELQEKHIVVEFDLGNAVNECASLPEGKADVARSVNG